MEGPVGVSEFEGHGRGLVDNRPRMPEHADDSPTDSENFAQVVETEKHASPPGKERHTPRRLSVWSRPRMTRS